VLNIAICLKLFSRDDIDAVCNREGDRWQTLPRFLAATKEAKRDVLLPEKTLLMTLRRSRRWQMEFGHYGRILPSWNAAGPQYRISCMQSISRIVTTGKLKTVTR